MVKTWFKSLVLGLALALSVPAFSADPIAPLPVLRFVDNNGQALSGGKLFTYAAGTTNKQSTFTDSTGGTPNTNPIILNARGEANVWLDPTLNYKFTLSPATDTDPPTSPIWTVDQLSGAVSATTLSTLAGAGGAGLLGFSQSAVYNAATVGTKLQQVVSVTDAPFNCDNTGSTDVATCAAAALASLPSAGGKLVFPKGSYLLSSLTVNKSVLIEGQGGGSQIYAKNANSNVLDITGNTITIRDLEILPSVTQSGGAYILMDTASSIVAVEDVLMSGWKTGIQMNGISDFMLRKVRLQTGVPSTGVAIAITSGIGITIQDVIETNALGQEPFAGLQILNDGDVSIINSQFIHNLTGMALTPGANQVVTSVYATNTFFDNNSQRSVLMAPTSTTGAVHRVGLNGSWFSSSGNDSGSGLQNILLDTNSVGGTIDGVAFVNAEIYDGDQQGLFLSGVGTKNIQVLGGKIAGNGRSGTFDAITISNGASGIQILGARIGPVGGLGANTGYAISLNNTINDLLIDGNNLTGNTSGTIHQNSTGSRRRIVNNDGYNPVGIAAITVTASPFSYTAGDTPETVYIVGGTVSLVQLNGGSLFATTNNTIVVPPGQTLIVTYSSLPAMAKSID